MAQRKKILHISTREMIRELRDQVLRVNGFDVASTAGEGQKEALQRVASDRVDLVLIDIDGEGRVQSAESLCSAIKAENPEQLVAFACNYRVAIDSDCPDDVIRSEFNPEHFVRGVKDLLSTAAI